MIHIFSISCLGCRLSVDFACIMTDWTKYLEEFQNYFKNCFIRFGLKNLNFLDPSFLLMYYSIVPILSPKVRSKKISWNARQNLFISSTFLLIHSSFTPINLLLFLTHLRVYVNCSIKKASKIYLDIWNNNNKKKIKKKT